MMISISLTRYLDGKFIQIYYHHTTQRNCFLQLIRRAGTIFLKNTVKVLTCGPSISIERMAYLLVASLCYATEFLSIDTSMPILSVPLLNVCFHCYFFCQSYKLKACNSCGVKVTEQWLAG